MIIYKRKKKQLVIPCGLGPVVCPDTSHNLQMKMVDSSTMLQQIEPDEGYYGLYRVIINPLTDDNLLPGNIRAGVTILGVLGTYSGELINLQAKTVDPTLQGLVVSADIGYDGLSSVTVNPVTADIDPNILAENIKKDVEILGVTGTFDGGPLQSKSVNSSTSSQSVTPDSSYYGLSIVTVNPYTVESKSQTITQNGTYSFAPASADALSDVSISVEVADTPATVQAKSVSYNANGEYTVTPDQSYDGLSSVDISVNVPTPAPVLQSKTVDSSTESQSVAPDQGYDGLSQVTVNPYTLDSKTVDPSTSQITVNSSVNGLSSVTVNAVTSNIDPDIQAGNIKRDVEILGVIGTFDGGSLGTKTVNSSTSSQTVTPESSDYGLSSVTVNPYTVETNSSTLTVNGTYTFTPQNADALSSVTIDVSVASGSVINNQNKTVDSSTSFQSITADSGYTGLGTVTVNPYTVEADSSTLIKDGTYTFTPQNADAISSMTVNVDVTGINNTSLTLVSPLSQNSLYTINTDDGQLNISQTSPGTCDATCPEISGQNLHTCVFYTLQSITGEYSGNFFRPGFVGCPKLFSVQFINLTTIDGYADVSYWIDPQDIQTDDFRISLPNGGAIHSSDPKLNIAYAPGNKLRMITFSQDITDDIYLTNNGGLNYYGVLFTLRALDTTVSGKNVYFYTNGLTVTDDAQGSIQAAYNAAVNAGWIINNLTILPYS